MSQKNDTLPLLLALLLSGAILGGGAWWLANKFGKPTPEAATDYQTFAQVRDVPSGLFNYGGSTTWAPIRLEVDAAIQTVWPQFQLRYTEPTAGAPGSGTGIKMLLDNQLAFSQSSRPLKEAEYQQAKDQGFTLQEIPVALDGIAVAVHPNLQLPGLTVAQLKQIYTGKLTNWKQVGGPNLSITAYSRPKEGGTVDFFVENVLEKENFASGVEFIPTTTQALRKVAQNPGGIYYASAPEVVPQCGIKSLPLGRKSGEWVAPYQEPFVPATECPNRRNQLNQSAFQKGTYPITRRLFVIVKKDGQVDEQAGMAYGNLLLTNQGQELIVKAGFVRIR